MDEGTIITKLSTQQQLLDYCVIENIANKITPAVVKELQEGGVWKTYNPTSRYIITKTSSCYLAQEIPRNRKIPQLINRARRYLT